MPAAETEFGHELNQPTISIVDDNAEFADVVAARLSSQGYTPEVYHSAVDFLNCFDALRPGCVLVDVRMPRLGGLELQEQLNRLPLRPPVLVMTAFAEVATALRAMRQGAIAFLQKPIADSELLRGFERALARPRCTQSRGSCPTRINCCPVRAP